jgi:hypothetical protein
MSGLYRCQVSRYTVQVVHCCNLQRHTVSKCNFKRSDISDLTCIQRSASGVPLACHAYLNIKQAGTHCRAGDQDAHLLFAARHS